MLEKKTMAFTTVKCGHALGKGVQYLRCLRRGGWYQFKIEIEEEPMEKKKSSNGYLMGRRKVPLN